MESDDDECDEWSKPIGEDAVVSTKILPASHTIHRLRGDDHSKVILHIDIDCFYAQVEMIRNPELRNKPLGIQQKYIVVTCNYPARERGVTKLMLIKEAKEKCPDLVLVSGEDLTHYREMSYKISGYLQKYCPLVERLGFDENFLDITELVNDRLAKTDPKDKLDVKGHLYEPESVQESCDCGCHRRLLLGSHVAADIREGLYSELGITCCGGVAHNKLLSKLVAGAHKPNQQTTLYPEQTASLMGKLTSARNIPGIGHSTAKRLREMGIISVHDLQMADRVALEEEFGAAMADTMKTLCVGVDESPVVAFGLPQTISDEDSFRKCSKFEEVKMKIRQLLTSLLDRLLKDGRTPHTLRLTVRKLNKGYTRESRQCNIQPSIFSRFSSDTVPKVLAQLEMIAVGLFTKMVDPKQPFHLTLINVAFAKMEQKSGNAITGFFSPKSKKHDIGREQSDSPQKVCTESLAIFNASSAIDVDMAKPSQSLDTSSLSETSAKSEQRKSGILKWFSFSKSEQKDEQSVNDMKQKEHHILQWEDSRIKDCDSKDRSYSKGDTGFFQNYKRKALRSEEFQEKEYCNKRSKPSTSKTSDFSEISIPSHIDRAVFSELPPEIQQEILKSNASASENDLCLGQEEENSFDRTSKTVSEKSEKNVKTNEDIGNIVKSKNTRETACNWTNNIHISNEEIEVCKSGSGESLTPPDIDRSVFVNLPPDIQQELIKDWKSKVKQAETNDNVQPHFKMPKPSSSNNILSYFSKSSKQ